ncbi:uncharacterized protein LOC129943040 [Eupeodes corollae]|uniref:uncharacterized protein LOC129943040 n=1 Tax=Eupeodes corollae TaxID=290404 RepID=UPI0024903860|nr:uncharacterized protein LOC129943040 [Eupeodes corollae]
MHHIVKCIVVYLIIASGISANDESSGMGNEIVERNGQGSWFKSAENVLAGPAGHVVVEVAKDLLSRSTGNSQVLSLNLTNLLVIILLKVLIFAAGILGAGHWSHYGRGRSFAPSSFFEDGEGHLITGFLAAQGSGNDGCLYQAACHSPVSAYEYARAAKALLNGIEKFEGTTLNNPRYNDLIVLVEKAAYDGYKGNPCDKTYQCNM